MPKYPVFGKALDRIDNNNYFLTYVCSSDGNKLSYSVYIWYKCKPSEKVYEEVSNKPKTRKDLESILDKVTREMSV